MSIVEVRNLTRTYKQGSLEVQALRGVDLDIEPGEFTVLMGPSGSGKTTLLNQIGALDLPDGGSVKVEGRELTRTLVEAVVSSESPLVGRSVRGVKFRTIYNAAIIAVHRSGTHLRGKIGNIRLQSGDTLLLEADRSFVETYRRSNDF